MAARRSLKDLLADRSPTEISSEAISLSKEGRACPSAPTHTRTKASITTELAALFRAITMPTSTAIPGESSSARLRIPDADKPSQSLRFVKLTENAYAPSKGSSRAAGYDLYSAYECEIPALGKAVVKTDIQIALPTGCYGRIAPRSGLAVNHFIDVGAGVIDEDYRGNVGVVLFNFGKEPFKVKKGDRIAQLICERIYYPVLEEAKELNTAYMGFP
ncbi:deoxyuridine 5'-triphosphate nucleotidohydrolase, mitochondrial isoform X2 [Python bivittatus]|uniref:Deoxyuridine 5'-triphosphate nucleotidohydrolase n=1 Tax=Python bivittatus TaxID=176946 RepID=A0A9F5MY92_PYTBI|nr:deoxyuridine 5'-triphosphate nucleotidohydrolase, mitochondrial isoform X2 [Python bivittatus]